VKEYTPNAAPESSTPSRAAAGFRAHLQGVGLHDLLMLQHLMRASGVYVVLSGERSGALHFSGGVLFHAETSDPAGGVWVGNRAASEILSWPDGEFVTSSQRPADRASVSLPIEELMGPAAVGAVEPAQSTATGIRRRSTLSGVHPPGVHSPGVRSRSAEATADPAGVEAPAAASSTLAQALAAVATPGTALATPRAMARPGELLGEIQVLVGPRGELLDGRGIGAEALASRVAYVTRLAELIGQAMGSGDAYGLKVRGPSGELNVRRHADGHISGSFGSADSVETTPQAPTPPPLPTTPPSAAAPAGKTSVPPPLPPNAMSSSSAVTPSAGPPTRRSRPPSS
jgi:Domain of unknown function (DUF4388)